MRSDITPLDLALPQIEATRWVVVWWIDGMRQERMIDDRALAEAYAAAHRGRMVPMANLVPWPVR
jgi:hypothetical protein